jgi:hypothetical protein
LTSAANLLCSFNTAQITSVTSSAFSSSISVLAKISLNCPNIASWYALAKENPNYGSTLYTSISSLSELGSIISGISIADLQLVSVDSMSSITTTAFQYMPAATVNSLSVSQLTGLSIDQVTALLNSPNYASFSSSIKNYLVALASGSSTATSGSFRLKVSNLAEYLFCFIILTNFI